MFALEHSRAEVPRRQGTQCISVACRSGTILRALSEDAPSRYARPEVTEAAPPKPPPPPPPRRPPPPRPVAAGVAPAAAAPPTAAAAPVAKPPAVEPKKEAPAPQAMSAGQKENITLQALGLLNEQVQARIVHYRGELETNAELDAITAQVVRPIEGDASLHRRPERRTEDALIKKKPIRSAR